MCKEYLIITACVLMGISYCFSGIISYFIFSEAEKCILFNKIIFKGFDVYIIKNNIIYSNIIWGPLLNSVVVFIELAIFKLILIVIELF